MTHYSHHPLDILPAMHYQASGMAGMHHMMTQHPVEQVVAGMLPSHGNHNTQMQPLPQPNSSISGVHNINSTVTGATGSERCKFCGLDLPLDAPTVVAHFNNHFKQFGLDSANPCSYETAHTLVDNRLSVDSQHFMNNQNDELMADQSHLPNHLISHSNGSGTETLAQNPSNFSYNYSTQAHPSNLSITNDHLKCSTSDPSNVQMRHGSCMEPESPNVNMHHNIANGNIQEMPSNLNLVEKPVPSHSAMVCNSNLVPANSHHPLDDSSTLGLAGNSGSPLNLTGRSKLDTVSAISGNLSGNNTPVMSSLEHTCSMPNQQGHITEHNLQQTQTGFNHSFENNFPIVSNFYGTSCSYNPPTQLQSQLPSCRLQQNFPHGLEGVGLTIPILSPNLNELTQDSESSPCMEHDAPPVSTLQHLNTGMPSHHSMQLDNHCLGIGQLAICSNAENSQTVRNMTQTECSMDMNLTETVMNSIEPKQENLIQTDFQCIECRQTFTDKLVYDDHLMTHINDNIPNIPYTKNFDSCNDVCPISDSTVCAVSSLPSSCQVSSSLSCHMTTTTLTSVPDEQHQQFHPKPYKCSICNEEFSVKEDLREHFQGHEAAKPFHCDTCGVGVSNHRALKRHKLKHTGFKPFKCDTCGKSFLQRHDLNRHVSIHDRPKYLCCEQCKRSFTAVSSFKSHKCKFLKEAQPFLCPICGDGCSNRLAWSYHMWKHTKNPTFVPFQENVLPIDNL